MTMRSFIDIVSGETPRSRLDEMVWEARYAAAKAIQRHPGCWIHFSNINKLGINPQAGHRDPPGVYFYPGKWLFSEEASLSQFATTYEYFFVVKLNMGPSFINLGAMRTAQVEKIATSNGWINDLKRVAGDPKLLADSPIMRHDPKLLKKPGGLFYGVMDYLVNVEKKYRWLQLLRGVGGLYDPGFGIIANGEPAQAVVIDARAIQILETGRNTDDMSRSLADAFRPVAETMGGKFFYRNKIPTIAIEQEGKTVEVSYQWFNYRWVSSYSKQGFMTTETDREYNHSTGDAQSVGKTMAYYLKKALEQADAEPVKTGPWDGVRMMQLRNLIGTLKARLWQGVRDGTFRIVANEYSSYGLSRSLSIETEDAQTIRFELSVERRSHGDDDRGYEIEFKRTFDGRATPEQVAHEALTYVWKELKPHLPGVTDVQQIEDIVGINFTSVA